MELTEKPHQGSLFRREVRQMPEGYYSGDKPNPNLRAFVDSHIGQQSNDPARDEYEVSAFEEQIVGTKATSVYNMHIYWSKKPHDAIRQYVLHYTKPGDLVLDPFCGSGVTALAALMEGRKAVAIDRSPAATFIAKNYCTPVDPDRLRWALDELKQKIEAEIGWLYETRCDRCGGKATAGYTVYSERFRCPQCDEEVPLFDCKEVQQETSKGEFEWIMRCPRCDKGEISTSSERLGSIPVLARYVCGNGCKPARSERRYNDADTVKRQYFEDYDLGKLREIDAQQIPYWYPPHKMMNVEDGSQPWGDKWRAGSGSFRSVRDLFTKRNLWAAACILNAIKSFDDTTVLDALLFALTGNILNCTRMYRERKAGRGIANGTYYLPPISRDMVVTNGLYYKIEQHLIPAYEDLQAITSTDLCISTQSACDLSAIPSGSVDYIFTDPPYAGKVQYGELNFVWEAWLGSDTTWHHEEITVNDVRGKTEADWAEAMRRAMAECHRVLKPGRWLSLCYHDTSEGTWQLVQDIMAEVGFIVDRSDSVLSIGTEQKSYNQITGEKVTKRDLVINFRKLRPVDTETDQQDADRASVGTQSFRESARQIIRAYLQTSAGATKDRVYDEMVSRLVRTGQMEAHNFEEILREVAEEVKEPRMKDLFTPENPNLFGTHEVSRWYLKETEESVVDAAESAREDAAAKVLRDYMGKRLTEASPSEGIHYSDLFEQYVYHVREKPRREMADWLVDYFFRTESGTWRPPASVEEERLKAEARSTGTNRRIKRFAALLGSGASIPPDRVPGPATLAGWIRQAKRTGMYDIGRLLYERGGLDLDRLPEETASEVEEDYQVCLRALLRAAGGSVQSKPGRGRKARSASQGQLI